ncbi:hypothetical protein ACE4RR_05830 [Alteribacillus sp. HJP-4]
MEFHAERMRQMVNTDPFLEASFSEAVQSIGDEQEALRMVYDSYIHHDHMMKNAYVHLTHV